MNIRFRYLFLGFGSFLVFLIYVLSDPDLGWFKNLPIGSGALSTIIVLLASVMYVGFLHLSRKALFDYLDFQEIAERAKQTSIGAGLLAVAISIAMVAISLAIMAAVG